MIVLCSLFCIAGLMVSSKLMYPFTVGKANTCHQIGLAWFFGARFDNSFKDAKALWGHFAPAVTKAVTDKAHDEL